MGDYGEQPGKRNKGPGGKAFPGSAVRAVSFGAAQGDLWGHVDPAKLQSAIRGIADRGGGLLLSITRDRTAATVTLFYNDERVRFYPPTAEAADILLDALLDWATTPDLDLSWWYKAP